MEKEVQHLLFFLSLAMKRIFIISFFIITGILSSYSFEFKNEDLHYVVSYKWGLIHKESGEATLFLRNNGQFYDIKLVGKTKPWADRIYQIRDTLEGRINKNNFRPVYYIKTAHEKDKYGKDIINYTYEGGKVTGEVSRLRKDKKGNVTSNTSTMLTATGKVFDMLSIFYYLRSVDYMTLTKGSEFKTSMFSGSKVEELTVKCEGIEKVKLYDKTEAEAYHIKFHFTTEGKKKSSEDIDTWISTDSRHIPLLIIGSLPVGQVRCYYVN